MPGVCPRCLREVYFAEEKLALGKVWHTFCFSCRNCRKLLDSCTVATHCGELFCRNCCTRLFAPSVQPPLSSPALDLPSNRREVPFSSAVRRPTSECDSFSDCYCCCCCQEDCSIGEIPSERTREARFEKQRLRGGGGEEEEPEEFRLAEETRRCSESECSNLGVVSSTTTLCNDVPSSPTAVTTWYNRQHSASQSTFGGQSYAKSPSCQRSSNNPTPGNVTKHFCNNNNNNSDRCLNIGGSYDNGRYKCSTNRRTENSCCPTLQQHKQSSQEEQTQEEQQEQEPKPQHQQQVHPKQLQGRQTQKLLKPKKQKQEISDPQLQEQQENLRLELREQQLKKKFQSNGLIVNEERKINSNRYQSSVDRFSRTSEVPEETSSSASGLTCPSKMPIEGNTSYHNNNNNNNAGGPSTAGENNPNNYSSSGQSCTGTHYETCYEMDEPNTDAGYPVGGGGGAMGYGRPSDLQIEVIRDRDEETRLRGGCGGCGSRGGCATTSGAASCPPRDECPREPATPCGTPSCDPPCGNRGGCCAPAGCRPVCRKPGRSCCPPCVAEPQGCGGGGCCGGGCRGGCGKPGRLCMPLRPCSAPPCQPQVCRPRGSPCTPPRCCAPAPPPCCKPPGIMTRPPSCAIGGGASCCRSKSPRRGCCSAPQDDAGCGYCGPRLPPGCECLGGGLDCQRCGCKVYQAEMQIASGVPYHNICFSCFCCRKPLEPLTYQENCGEIYCKHCYVRNFGPQGYGYGAGAGVLQTPM